MTESTVHAEKTCGFFAMMPGLYENGRKPGRKCGQKETLMSPEIAVGCGTSLIPMEFCQS